LLAQEFAPVEVIAVDDRSSDATPDILARLAREDSRLRVVSGEPLPAGWVGKPWALEQGQRYARGAWLLFTDADSVHAPGGVASAAWFAREARADALSIATRQDVVTFWERALIPSSLGLILFASGTFGDINDPAQPDRALANGQYILVSREAYDEDVEFARRLKADGRFRLLLAGGDRLASVRMYRSFGEIWAGFTKNVYLGANGDLRVLALGIAFMSLISFVPPALALRAAFRGRYRLVGEALMTSLAIVATASWGMRKAAFPKRLALLQPLGTALFAAIAVNSALRVISGKGVVWRGRRYHGR
jgi:chlorobactene glucosyltransferase